MRVGSPFAADSNLQLAALYRRSGDIDRAEQLLHFVRRNQQQGSLDVYREAWATLILAKIYFAREENEQVVSLVEELLAKSEKEQFGPVWQITPRETLGHALVRLGAYDRAETTLKEVLALRKEHLGENDLDNLETYAALSELNERRGDAAEALRWARGAVEVANVHLNSASAVLSERQQLLMRARVAGAIDHYLSLSLRSGVDPGEIYSVALAWKGAVFARQRAIKVALRNADAATQELADELSAVDLQLASAAFNSNGGAADEWSTTLKKLTDQKELLESKLAQKNPSFAAATQDRLQIVSQLQAKLSTKTVLVDFLRYTSHPSPVAEKSAPQKQYLAFVVASAQPPIVVDLGPANVIETATHAWRTALARSDEATLVEVSGQLRKLVWMPIQQHLTSGDTILLSPDGDLAQLAFCALPGAAQGSYLLEEFPLAVAAVPQMLTELPPKVVEDSLSKSLLLIGDVDFNASAGPADEEVAGATSALAARSAEEEQTTWRRLPGTKAEIESIGRMAGNLRRAIDVQMLTRSDATPAAIRRQAPSAQWLHIASHGFFAQVKNANPRNTESVASSLELSAFGRESIPGFHPGLLSGLVLAGANQKPDAGQDDGILTSLEVASLNLDQVELSVLSACETGLGEAAGGEGVLGLQRAFQVAGAQTTVATLWQIPDEPTRVLMERFYTNLWEKNMGKLAALREAQLWMLTEGRTDAGVQRGMVFRESSQAAPSGRLPPYYWAAFTLSGDWR